MALLTILNPNERNTTEFSYEDYDMQFDFSRQNFMFATTEAQSVFHALMDRCERIDLEEYSYDDLAKIVAIKLRKVKFGKGVLEEIAPVLRGNARAAQKMAIHIRNYLKAANKKSFVKADWDKLCDHLAILPLGINPIELQLLRHLSERKECSLTYLAAKTGLTKPCLQRDYEVYLQKQNLMEISTAGRAITPKGKDYLRHSVQVFEILDQRAQMRLRGIALRSVYCHKQGHWKCVDIDGDFVEVNSESNPRCEHGRERMGYRR